MGRGPGRRQCSGLHQGSAGLWVGEDHLLACHLWSVPWQEIGLELVCPECTLLKAFIQGKHITFLIFKTVGNKLTIFILEHMLWDTSISQFAGGQSPLCLYYNFMHVILWQRESVALQCASLDSKFDSCVPLSELLPLSEPRWTRLRGKYRFFCAIVLFYGNPR